MFDLPEHFILWAILLFGSAATMKLAQKFTVDVFKSDDSEPQGHETHLNELYENEEAALGPFHDARKIYSQGDCPRCWDADEELVTVDPVCDDHGEEIGRQCRECNWGYVHSELNKHFPKSRHDDN